MSQNLGLVLSDLACTRGNRQLFSNLSLDVQPGQLLRVRGANGAGKTSLLRMLCGLLLPSSGQVLWCGKPLADQREKFGQDLMYLGHAAALKDELSPLENLLDACALGGHAPEVPAAIAALQSAGLRGHERTPARRLSQGQRRRSALARLALSQNAPLWILDEPFNALDTAANAWLTGLIEAHLQSDGMVVLTSHQDLALTAPSQVDLTL
jgi:heme exporter protein A